MIPPFFACTDAGYPAQMRRRHQERKHQMLTFWRDGLERQLAAINAALSTLERQIQDSSES